MSVRVQAIFEISFSDIQTVGQISNARHIRRIDQFDTALDLVFGKGIATFEGFVFAIATEDSEVTKRGNLYRIDPATGIPTLLGNVGIKVNIGGMAFNTAGQLFFTNQKDSAAGIVPALYSIDVNAGQSNAQLVGLFPDASGGVTLGSSVVSLTFDNQGRLWGIDPDLETFILIGTDPSNGGEFLAVAAGAPQIFLMSMDYSSADNNFYVYSAGGALGSTQIRRIRLTHVSGGNHFQIAVDDVSAVNNNVFAPIGFTFDSNSGTGVYGSGLLESNVIHFQKCSNVPGGPTDVYILDVELPDVNSDIIKVTFPPLPGSTDEQINCYTRVGIRDDESALTLYNTVEEFTTCEDCVRTIEPDPITIRYTPCSQNQNAPDLFIDETDLTDILPVIKVSGGPIDNVIDICYSRTGEEVPGGTPDNVNILGSFADCEKCFRDLVVVVAVEIIPVGPVSMQVGDSTLQLNATVVFSNGTRISLQNLADDSDVAGRDNPAHARRWTFDPTGSGVAVSLDTSARRQNPIVATAVAEGSGDVFVEVESSAFIDGEFVQSNKVRIDVASPDPTLDSIVVTPNQVTIDIGEGAQFTATANFSDGATQDVTSTATWSITSSAIATINTSGSVTGVSEGQTIVRAQQGGATSNDAIVIVRVEVPPIFACPPATLTVTREQIFFEHDSMPDANREYGSVVAVKGTTAVVTSPRKREVSGNRDLPNIVEIWQFIGTEWQFQQVLYPNESLDDRNIRNFGLGLAIDGNVIVVSMQKSSQDPDTNTDVDIFGQIFIYRFNGVVWVRDQTILEPSPGATVTEANVDSLWGQDKQIALSGGYLLVGSTHSSVAAAKGGAAYVYKDDGNSFNLETTITPDDPRTNDAFGSAVALGTVGGVPTAFVSSIWHEEDGSGRIGTGLNFGRGAVYAFRRTTSPVLEWVENVKINATEEPGVIGRRFGISVSFDTDNATLAVGQISADPTLFSSVYVYAISNGSSVLDVQLREQDVDLTGTSGVHTGFGQHVVIEGNSIFASVGPDNFDCSRIIYYKKVSGDWTLNGVFIVDTIVAAGVENNPRLSFSNGRLVVGQPSNDDLATSAGAVIYYKFQTVEASSSSSSVSSNASSSSSSGSSASSSSSVLDLNQLAEDLVAVCDPCDSDEYFVDPYIDEYGLKITGKWYYRQDKPGSAWFDRVDNTKGWTVDFTLAVNSVENVDALSNTDKPDGLGIYVNDGTYYETLYFLTQEIIFANADRKLVFDTTDNVRYRLIGKDRSLQLFGQSVREKRFKKIADVNFNTKASNEGNGRQPATVQDSQGVDHVVWYDDGNQQGQLLYAKLDNGVWDEPELLISTPTGLQNPDIDISADGQIYVVFESKELEATNVGFVYKNHLGWSGVQFIGTGTGDSRRPKLSVDTQGDVHVVWEDHRFEHPEIFYNRRSSESLSWMGDTRVTEVDFGAYRPSIDTYRETAFIAWTDKSSNDTSLIKVSSYNASTNAWTSSYQSGSDVVVSEPLSQVPDYSDVLVTVAAKVFISWQDNFTDQFEIYNRIFATDLAPLSDIQRITDACKDSLYSRLSEHKETGDVYLAWEDYRELGVESLDPYCDPYGLVNPPHIFVAHYDSLNRIWESSANSSFDVRLDAQDLRRWTSPAISDSFSGNLHVLYDALLAADEYLAGSDEYMRTTDVFHNIRDARYDLTRVEVYTVLADSYGETDLLVSDRALRKEIRFGDFSNTLSCDFVFGNIKYYLENAVEPFEIIPISSIEYPVSDFSVNDAVVNNHGDAWLATGCGIIFYFANAGSVTILDDSAVAGVNIRAITFDRNNIMYVATDNEIFSSIDHVSFVSVSVTGASNITALAFDKNNRLFVGTEANGLLVSETGKDDKSIIPDAFVTSIKVDDANVVWIGTYTGLVRLFNNHITIFTTKNGLPSDRINNISIRNTALRYLGTGTGVVKMVGSSFVRVNAQDASIWNDNVKSVLWQEPNILWAGTLSKLNQISVDDGNNAFTSQSFDVKDYSNFETAFDGEDTYFILTDQLFDQDCYAEVFINGTRVKHGYHVVLRSDSNSIQIPFSLVKFDTKLKSTDRVDVKIRTDVKSMASFVQSKAEQEALGSSLVRIKDVSANDDQVLVVAKGGENEVKVNENDRPFPYERIHLDAIPPTGEIVIVEQIDATTLRVRIDSATDGENGSGLDKMVVSNFTNFTTDGTITQDPVPFETPVLHNIGVGLDTVTDQLTFSTGNGSIVEFIVSDNQVYAAQSLPGVLYRFTNKEQKVDPINVVDFDTPLWEIVVEFGDDKHIDFMTKYNDKYVLGVGDNGSGSAQIYVYEDTTFTDPTVFAVNGSRAFSSVVLDNILYIGTGPSGALYSFDGDQVSLLLSGIATNIYDLAAHVGNLYAATGEAGQVYIVDPTEPSAPVVHSDSDTAVTAINVFDFSGNKIFIGTSTEGKVLRSNISDISFNRSFKTLSGKVSAIKDFGGVLYTAVGKTIYFFSNTGSWTWRYTHAEDINDITFDSFTQNIYVVSDSKVSELRPLTQEKTVYLKLIDKAGNETELFDSDGNVVTEFTDSISISDLEDFINSGKIIELDSSGNIISSFGREGIFFSGEKIEEEKGIYESQVFNGTI